MQSIAEKMIDCYLAPESPNDTRETMLKSERKWINRHTLSFLDHADKIDSYLKDGDIKGANKIRYTSLFSMISKLESGLFPNLNNSKDEVEEKIKSYISNIMESY